MLVNPVTMLAEARHLAELGVPNPLSLVTVEGEALVTTPAHMLINRLREELRGDGRHGSCGMGIGETVAEAEGCPEPIRVRDLLNPKELDKKLGWHLRRMRALMEGLHKAHPGHPLSEEVLGDGLPLKILSYFEEWAAQVQVVGRDWLGGQLAGPGAVFFEGAQGVLLDQHYGWFPHVTRSHTTFRNADKLIEGAGVKPFRVGVVRAHMSRHGAGPFVTEDPAFSPPGDHNQKGPWQGSFRFGHFDLVAYRYAIEALGGVDGLAVTHLDQPSPLLCTGYRAAGEFPTHRLALPALPGLLVAQEKLTEWLGHVGPVYEEWRPSKATIGKLLGAPVVASSTGPTRADFACDLTTLADL